MNFNNNMKYVQKIHQTMENHNILLAYDGLISPEIITAFTEIAEKNFNIDDETLMKKVYHVMVECLQNICKHAVDIDTGKTSNPGKGIFLVAFDNNEYRVITGNAILNQNVTEIQENIKEINSLNEKEIKELYMKTLKNDLISDRGGAGLGLIDMARKTKQKIGYYFETVNDKTSFISLSIRIPKE